MDEISERKISDRIQPGPSDLSCFRTTVPVPLGDPADNMLLECCLESKATILITGDRDLLDMKVLPFYLEILTPRKYLEQK